MPQCYPFMRHLPFFLVMIIAVSLSACTTTTPLDLGEIPPDYIALTPDLEAEATARAFIEFPPTSFEAPREERFAIFFDNVHRCHGRDFITIRVVNEGNVDFLWARELMFYYWGILPDGMDIYVTSNQYDIEKPFLPDPGSCPNTMGDSGILRPGETAYIGLYMGFDFDDWGYEMFGDRGWEDIESLSFVVYLYTSEYPETSSSITESIDISFIIEDMPDRSRRPPTPGPILEPVPTATKSPGIGG